VPVPIDYTIDYEDGENGNPNHQDWHEDNTERFPYRAADWRPLVPLVTDRTCKDSDFEWEVRLQLNKEQGSLAIADLGDLESLNIFANYQFK
jgi:uncharacterized protein YegL